MKMKSFPLILGLAAIMTVGGVAATWSYASGPAAPNDTTIPVNMNPFIYVPEEMPDEEITVIERLSDILNKQYSNDTVQDSLSYLLDNTILVTWGDNDEQYVGSMDKNYEDEINALFGDVLEKTDEDKQVSFLLKEEDLKGDNDEYREIVMYSTSDTLDNTTNNYDGVVCVYVTVFTPRVENGVVTGYDLVCESLRGYCSEIRYSPSDTSPSFSTDTWRDGVAVYNWRGVKQQKLTGDDLNNFSVYNNPQGWFDDYTQPDGNDLSKVLADKL